MTTPDQLRQLVEHLKNRVRPAAEDERAIVFDNPGVGGMIADGLDEATVRRLLAVPWWSEMVDDIVETPEFADPNETAQDILGYARDVLVEYIGKRFPLDE